MKKLMTKKEIIQLANKVVPPSKTQQTVFGKERRSVLVQVKFTPTEFARGKFLANIFADGSLSALVRKALLEFESEEVA